MTAQIPKLYASLTGPLLGLYLPLPFENPIAARLALNTSKLKGLWCSVYTRAEAERCVRDHGGQMLPASMAKHLDYDTHELRKAGF
jgi:hypothetical protein